MKAILLAAGLGTRLRPLTDIVPKCMVPVNGVPLLVYWIKMLEGSGVSKVLVNLHYKAEWFESCLPLFVDMNFIEFSYEDELLGTGGTVLKNKEFIGEDDFMLVHADNLSFFDINLFVEAFKTRPKKAVFTMMTFMTQRPRSCGIVELDESSGLVTGFHEKVSRPPSNYANAAVYIFSNQIVSFLEAKGQSFIDISTEVIPFFLGRFNQFLNDDFHRDLGHFEDYYESQALYLKAYEGPLPELAWMDSLSEQYVQQLAELLAQKLGLELCLASDIDKNKVQLLFLERFLEDFNFNLLHKNSVVLFKKVPPGFLSKDFKSTHKRHCLALCQSIDQS